MSQGRIFQIKQIKVNITSSIDISPNQQFFSIVTRTRGKRSSMYDYKLELYNLSNFNLLNTTLIYSSYNQRNHPCKILADSKTIVVTTLNQIFFYDNKLNLKHKDFHNLLYVYDMKVSPDGKIVALIGDSQILMWNTATYQQIIFPTIKAIIKNCQFSDDNTFIGVLSDMIINFYQIVPFGQTYQFQLSFTTDFLDEATLKQLLSNGAFSTFDFNPHNNQQIVIGFGNASPRKVNFATRTISKVANIQQPSSKQNFKVVKFLPDGKRVISGDYLNGVGYWPGSPNSTLVYRQNFIFLGVEPYAGGRRALGYVWETVKAIQIQFKCKNLQFAASCSCAQNQYWDMSKQSCQTCIQNNNNICQCKQPGFKFNPDVAACVFDCSKVNNALNLLYRINQANTCYCARGYIWDKDKCVLDCQNIFSQGPGPTQQTCICKPFFFWNNKTKVCGCGQNKRLVITDKSQVLCECIQNYYLSDKNECIVNCTLISYNNGTSQANSSCLCQEGFYFDTYDNLTALIQQNQQLSRSQTIFTAKTSTCIKNCSLIKNTIGAIKSNECLCIENMIWNGTDCVLNCKTIPNGVQYVNNNGTQTCTCSLGYTWVPQNRQCGRNCTNIKFLNKSSYPTAISCPCIQNFQWFGMPKNQCVIDCKKIKFSQSYSIDSSSSCICRNLFYWDEAAVGCLVNCTQIWDASSRLGMDQCQCNNNKYFNKTSFTCQDNIQSTFNKPFMWAILGIGALFLIIVGTVMLNFCCKFSTNKENKQRNKKLRKNTGPKIKKKIDTQNNIISSQRVLNK